MHKGSLDEIKIIFEKYSFLKLYSNNNEVNYYISNKDNNNISKIKILDLKTNKYTENLYHVEVSIENETVLSLNINHSTLITQIDIIIKSILKVLVKKYYIKLEFVFELFEYFKSLN